LVLLGIFSGFLGSLLGVGGGIIVVPILILAFSFEARSAVGTSLVMVVFTALFSTIAYYAQKRIDWKVGLAGAFVTVPGAALGAYLTQFFTSRILAIIFAFTAFIMAVTMIKESFHTGNRNSDYGVVVNQGNAKSERGIWSRRIIDAKGMIFEYDARTSGLVFLFLGGLASGFLGIGGGLIVVPILATIVGLPMHLAVATSMITMVFTSISGVSTHIMLGNVKFEYAVPLVIGILLGTQLGPRTAIKLRSATLERVFGLAVICIGVILLITG
jgi:hypothetical protein